MAPDGGNNWVAAGYPRCGEGPQSPISFVDAGPVERRPVAVSTSPTSLRIGYEHENVAFGFPVSPDPKQAVVVGVRYSLSGFHFHYPPEHDVGSPATFELHMKSSFENTTAVFGVLFRANPASKDRNPALDEVIAALRAGPNPPRVNVFPLLQHFLDQRFYDYIGSLTTPGCDGGIQWYVLQQPVDIPPEQSDSLYKELVERHMARPNARGLKPVKSPIHLLSNGQP